MKTILFIIVGIVLMTIIHFIIDMQEQNKEVAAEGGMRQKYSTLVDYLLSIHPDAKIFNETKTSIMVGVKGMSGTTVFDITKAFSVVIIQYKVNNIVTGNHKIEWQFPENGNQEDMINKINEDIAKYNSKVISNFT